MSVLLICAFFTTFLSGTVTGIWLSDAYLDGYEDVDPDTMTDWTTDPFEERP